MSFTIRNARHNGVGGIDLEWKNPYRGWEWFTASPEDPEQHGRDIFAQAISGKVAAFNPPTVMELRSSMGALTRRQLRLSLVRGGISLALVEGAIAAMPNGPAKDEARIEWEDAATFDRMHPTLLLVAQALGLTDEQVDALWAQASAI